MPIDYSKWKNIEVNSRLMQLEIQNQINLFLYKKVSDDEDDTHPNIDTPSLFRWRHQARVDRMAQAEQEKTEFQKTKKEYFILKIQIIKKISVK